MGSASWCSSELPAVKMKIVNLWLHLITGIATVLRMRRDSPLAPGPATTFDAAASPAKIDAGTPRKLGASQTSPIIRRPSLARVTQGTPRRASSSSHAKVRLTVPRAYRMNAATTPTTAFVVLISRLVKAILPSNTRPDGLRYGPSLVSLSERISESASSRGRCCCGFQSRKQCAPFGLRMGRYCKKNLGMLVKREGQRGSAENGRLAHTSTSHLSGLSICGRRLAPIQG